MGEIGQKEPQPPSGKPTDWVGTIKDWAEKLRKRAEERRKKAEEEKKKPPVAKSTGVRADYTEKVTYPYENLPRAVVRPRQVAMYLAKVLTPRSYPEIGRKFGGRDHSTVIHAVRLIEDLRKRDADMDGDVRSLLRQLET